MSAALFSGGPGREDFEAVVAGAFQRELRDEATVMANVWVPLKAMGRAEIDVVVLDGRRLTLCEVKSWSPRPGTSTQAPIWKTRTGWRRENAYRKIASRVAELSSEPALAGLELDHLVVLPSPPQVDGPRIEAERVLSLAGAVDYLKHRQPTALDEQRRDEVITALVGPRPPIPSSIATYDSLELDGGGPGYRSFRAVDTADGTRVYLKVIDANLHVMTAAERARLQELWYRDHVVRTKLSQVRGLLSPIPQPLSPSVVTLDHLVVAYPWAHQTTLRRLVRDGKPSCGELLAVLRRCAEVVEEVNGNDVLLRHLNPDAVLVRGDDVLVTGLEWAKHGAVSTGFPRLIVHADSSPYIAPEVKLDHTRPWPRADVFSVAAVSSFAIVGEDPPGPGDDLTLGEWLDAAGLTPAVAEVLRRGLATESAEIRRPLTPTAFVEELETALENEKPPRK